MKLYESGEYRATKNWPYAISAGCLVYKKTESGVQVLLLARDSSLPGRPRWYGEGISYHIPKGHCAVDETIADCAVRETMEESGCKVSIESYLGALEDEFTHPGKDIHMIKTTHYLAALWKSDLPSIDDEHDGKVWVSLDEAEKLLGPPNPKREDEIVKRLREFLELQSEV